MKYKKALVNIKILNNNLNIFSLLTLFEKLISTLNFSWTKGISSVTFLQINSNQNFAKLWGEFVATFILRSSKDQKSLSLKKYVCPKINYIVIIINKYNILNVITIIGPLESTINVIWNTLPNWNVPWII